jgi:hypothetical protein
MIRRVVSVTHRTVAAVWACPQGISCWIRARYPEWAPARGHVALVALCGCDEQPSVSSERVTPS